MKVGELVSKLAELDPNARVRVIEVDGPGAIPKLREVLTVTQSTMDKDFHGIAPGDVSIMLK